MSDKSAAVEDRLNALVSAIGPMPPSTSLTPITSTGLKTIAVSPNPIPGGTASQQRWHVSAAGLYTTTNAPTAIDFFTYYGTTGAGTQISDTPVAAADLLAGAGGLGWGYDGDIVFRSAADVCVKGILQWHGAAGVGGSRQYVTVNDTAVSTGADTLLTFAFAFTGGTGLNLTTYYVHFERKA